MLGWGQIAWQTRVSNPNGQQLKQAPLPGRGAGERDGLTKQSNGTDTPASNAVVALVVAWVLKR